MTNFGNTFTKEELTYFVKGFLIKVRNMDITKAKNELAGEMGRTKGSMTYHQKHVLYILTDGEEGKDNFNAELPAVVEEVRQELGLTKARMAYWFE